MRVWKKKIWHNSLAPNGAGAGYMTYIIVCMLFLTIMQSQT